MYMYTYMKQIIILLIRFSQFGAHCINVKKKKTQRKKTKKKEEFRKAKK